MRELQSVFGGDSVDRALRFELEHGGGVKIGGVTANTEVAETVALDVGFDERVKVVVGEGEGADEGLGGQEDEDVGLKFERELFEHCFRVEMGR